MKETDPQQELARRVLKHVNHTLKYQAYEEFEDGAQAEASSVKRIVQQWMDEQPIGEG